MPTTDAIQAIGLSKLFDGRHVLRQIDLKVAAGESVAIMGANGAGKTTLLRCLAGVARPDAGELRWHGEKSRRCFRATRLVGMAAHESQLYAHLTLHENLLFAARMHTAPQPRRQAREWLERIGLSSYANCLPCQISHGMRRRASLARALIHQPRIVLLDEPSAGLDREGQAWLAELMTELQRNKQSICFTTHDARQAQLCADRVLCLCDGKLQEACAVQEPTLRDSLSHRTAA